MNVVRLVAGTMVADVCSIYRRTEGDRMELIATEGLREDAIHRTFLALDEGLVGQIAQTAQPLSIQDAPRHPNFSYRPETGEDPYHAFLRCPDSEGRTRDWCSNRAEPNRAHSIKTMKLTVFKPSQWCLAEIATVRQMIAVPEQTEAAKEGRAVNLQGRSAFVVGLEWAASALHDPVIPAARFFAEDPEI